MNGYIDNFEVRPYACGSNWCINSGNMYLHEDGIARNNSSGVSAKYVYNTKDEAQSVLDIYNNNKGKQMFTKKDLKTGMTIEFDDCRKAVVQLGHDYGDIIIFDKMSYVSLDYLGKDLLDAGRGSSDYTCVAVYKPISQMNPFGNHCSTPIWVRDIPKEMTVAEIEKALGHSVKVVK